MFLCRDAVPRNAREMLKIPMQMLCLLERPFLPQTGDTAAGKQVTKARIESQAPSTNPHSRTFNLFVVRASGAIQRGRGCMVAQRMLGFRLLPV